MKLKAIREALGLADAYSRTGEEDEPRLVKVVTAARSEAAEVEQALRKAASLTSFAVAGLSAFHGNQCDMSRGAHPSNAAECSDPRCRAWAAALLGREAPPDTDVEALRARVNEMEDAVRAQVLRMLDVQQSQDSVRNAALEEAAQEATKHRPHTPVAFDIAHGIRALKKGA